MYCSESREVSEESLSIRRNSLPDKDLKLSENLLRIAQLDTFSAGKRKVACRPVGRPPRITVLPSSLSYRPSVYQGHAEQ